MPLSRTLEILADGQPVVSFRHARLTGRDGIGLLPESFQLWIWNLSESDYLMISRAKELAVLHQESVVASGTITMIYRRAEREGIRTVVIFSPGIELWEANVSLSIEGGVTASETVKQILDASGTGLSLLSFPGSDPVFSRGQAFFGRAAECINFAISATNARGCLTPSGLCVVPEDGLPVSMVLKEEDLIDVPSFTMDGHMILRTRVTGWPLGKMISVSWKGEYAEGLVVDYSVDADNLSGPWGCELLAEVKQP